MNAPANLAYRHDIDGLRAISMLVILIVHLDLPWLPGGFVAVDLFFVISGYVITRIIFGSMQQGRFSLRDFYRRRVRRLLPAMAFMLSATLVACSVLLPPAAFLEFAASVVAVIFFAANFFFWNASDYFAVAAELKPLLHCWTLAVEEQLYLVFPPLLLWLARRSSTAARVGTVALFALSFVTCVYLTYTDKLAAFYLMPARAWEFLAGAIVAMDILPRLQKQWLREAFTVAGLLLIASAMLVIREQDAFPGFYALWPVLGCVLIIHGGNTADARAAAFLRWQPLVYIGCISYSLYLWHWPLIALANNLVQGELSPWLKLALAAAAIGLGSFSYHVVEQPFRRHHKAIAWLTLRRGLALSALIALAGSGAYALVRHGDYGAYQDLLQSQQDYRGYRPPCDLANPAAENIRACTFGDHAAQKTFLMWGDSHAFALFPAFDIAATQQGWRGLWVNRAGCPPLFDVWRLDGQGTRINGIPSDTNCAETAQVVRDYLRAQPVDLIFLVSRWSIWEQGLIQNGRLRQDNHFLSDATTQSHDAAAAAVVYERALRNTVAELVEQMRIPVVALAPVPVLSRPVAELAPTDVALTRADYDRQLDFTARVFDDLSRHTPAFAWIDISDAFCTPFVCLAFDNGQPLYADDNHTSRAGALRLTRLVDAALARATAQRVP